MIQEIDIVRERYEVAAGIHVLRFASSHISRYARPGQFINVRTNAGLVPLLRRPFSICRIEGEDIEIVFNVVGIGTSILASKRSGDTVDVLGPLGASFRMKSSFDTALMVAGGLGVAPFPFLTQHLSDKKVESFIGAASAEKLWTAHLQNVHIATDDGSKGFHGTVVAMLAEYLKSNRVRNPKIFGCGPTKMMQALSDLAKMYEMDCELSLEGTMACGIGICQGCPVGRVNGKKKYALVCTEGPTFNSQDVVLA